MNGLGRIFFGNMVSMHLLVALGLVFFGLPVRAAGGSVTVSGLEQGDVVHFYAMATVSESSQESSSTVGTDSGSESGDTGETADSSGTGGDMVWVSAMAEWLTENSGTEIYKNFLTEGPAALRRLSQENVGTFIQTIIPEMKTEGGDFRLPECKTDFLISADEGTEIKYPESSTFPAGCYIILIEGANRVYSPIFLFMQSGSEVTVSISDKDWSSPKASVKVLREDGSTAVSGNDAVTAGELLQAVTEVTFPTYPAVYGVDKRIQAVCQISGPALQYEEGSFSVSKSVSKSSGELEQGKEYQLLEQGREYQLKEAEGVSVFWPAGDGAEEEEALFYLSRGWYYLMDGQAAGNELSQVLAKYNEIHDTHWTETKEEKNCSVRIIIPVEKEGTDAASLRITVGYRVGNTYYGEKSMMVENQCLYSVSPVNVDKIAVWMDRRTFQSRRILLTLYDGGLMGADSSGDTTGTGEVSGGNSGSETESVVESVDSAVLSGGIFEVFRLGTTLTDNPTTQDIQNYVASVDSARYRVLWMTDMGTSTKSAEVYLSIGSFTTDETGCGGIAGLSASDNGYLVVQTGYPEGYGMSRTAYRIDDWIDTEGNPVWAKEILWTDYTGVFLPETGGGGTDGFLRAGCMLMLSALLLGGWQILSRRRTGS